MSSTNEPTSSSSIIKPLNDTNYSRWRLQMVAVMKEKKIWKYVQGETKIDSSNAEDDQSASGFITSRVEFSQQSLIPENATAKQTWDILCAHHEKGGPQARMLAFTELLAMRYNEGDDMKSHLNSMRELNNRLRR
jgi:hypothetical protein